MKEFHRVVFKGYSYQDVFAQADKFLTQRGETELAERVRQTNVEVGPPATHFGFTPLYWGLLTPWPYNQGQSHYLRVKWYEEVKETLPAIEPESVLVAEIRMIQQLIMLAPGFGVDLYGILHVKRTGATYMVIESHNATIFENAVDAAVFFAHRRRNRGLGYDFDLEAPSSTERLIPREETGVPVDHEIAGDGC